MNDLSDLIQPDRGEAAHPIHIVDKQGFDAWLRGQSEAARAAVAAQRFGGGGYEHAILPGERPDEWAVVTGVADRASLSCWCLARLPDALPAGRYRLAGGDAGAARLGWLLAQYRFDRYRSDRSVSAEGASAADGAQGPRVLLVRDVAGMDRVMAEAEATFEVRDLVNTPALDAGPDALEAAVRALPGGGATEVTRGDALAAGFPLIHAVGMAAARGREPRLVEHRWGDPAHPRVAIVGKGVTFDTGGLDIKPAAGMRLMKKDMGGAAHAIALAGLIVALRLPVRLHLLVPVAENAISGAALRPGDVVRARGGRSVEIDNTDAEGRLILADALVKAGEEEPELIIDFATLTGAARVALGPDLPALFANDDRLAQQLLAAAEAEGDPMWRLPLWEGYREMLASDIADTANSGGSFAGAITAALFLKEFVPDGVAWAHIDTFAWRPSARPGRPKGGEALGLRAAAAAIAARFGRES